MSVTQKQTNLRSLQCAKVLNAYSCKTANLYEEGTLIDFLMKAVDPSIIHISQLTWAHNTECNLTDAACHMNSRLSI